MGAGRRKKPQIDAKRKPRKQSQSRPRNRTVQPRKAGRPRLPFDHAKAIEYAALGRPQGYVAGKLGVSHRTLARELARNADFGEAYDKAYRAGASEWDDIVFRAMEQAVRKRHSKPLCEAYREIQAKYAVRQDEKPLLLEVTLSDGSCLYVPEGMDPIAAAEHAENIFSLPEWEFPTRGELEETKG